MGTYRDTEQELGHTEIQSIGGDIQRYRVREGTEIQSQRGGSLGGTDREGERTDCGTD